MASRNESLVPEKYFSRGSKISKSGSHPDMWIVDNADGFHFHAITASAALMWQLHPPDPDRVRKRITKVLSKGHDEEM